MEIGGLQKTTLIDYPGKIACTVFLIGCNFRCPFCYSAELVLPEKIKDQPRIDEKDFFRFLKERREYLQGVVVCGGEPTIHSDLPDFLAKIKKMGYFVKLDTNGTQPQVLKSLIDKKLVDYIAMDIKAPLDDRYDRATGVHVDITKIKASIELIKQGSIDYEFRTTVVPTLHSLEDILTIARQLAPAKRFYLQNFRPEKTLDEKFLSIKPFAEEELEKIAEQIRSEKLVEECKAR
ncbi:MAG: anaerobic ribonucleoside-triphosphate reductase activating protein [Candidatus Pacebacteria bacterium]|nr:anaerobic ribonucleoside-triphosphate reductase activating protein [Candidatus Paceibacterota bacterium]